MRKFFLAALLALAASTAHSNQGAADISTTIQLASGDYSLVKDFQIGMVPEALTGGIRARFLCSKAWAGNIGVVDNVYFSANPTADRAANAGMTITVSGVKKTVLDGTASDAPLHGKPEALAAIDERANNHCRPGTQQAALPAASCRDKLDCWGEKDQLRAASLCAPLVERHAKFSHEWTDGWLGAKFTHYRWKDKEAGIVTHVGDSIRFQNGFGAWSNMIYECDFDPATSRVLDVRVRVGPL